MIHYFLENQPEEIRKQAEKGFTGPVFVGQGCTQRCGSDSYGYYVADILKPNRLVALVGAESRFVTSWASGDMTSEMPVDIVMRYAVAAEKRPCQDFTYLARYGKGWYYCEPDRRTGEMVRIPGRKAGFSWNGAYSYRDPSF